MSYQPSPSHQFQRRPSVLARYGISTATLYRWMAEGLFPKSVKLGPNTNGWRESDLQVFDQDPATYRERVSNDAV